MSNTHLIVTTSVNRMDGLLIARGEKGRTLICFIQAETHLIFTIMTCLTKQIGCSTVEFFRLLTAQGIFLRIFFYLSPFPPFTPPPLISFDTSAPRGTLGVRRTIKGLGPAPTTFDEVIFICIHKVLILTIRYWQSSNFINTSNKHFFSIYLRKRSGHKNYFVGADLLLEESIYQ